MKLFQNEEEVNAFLGIQPISEPDLSWVQPEDRKAVLATVKLFNVFKAHNKANDFKPDYRQGKRNTKYFPWLEVQASDEKPSGFGFSAAGYDLWTTYTFVGSRLECGTKEEAIHIGTAFDYLYKDAFLLE